MTKTGFIALAALLVLIGGCVQSLQPLYTAKTIVTDSTLIGTWEDEKDGNTWQFTQGVNRSYTLEYTEKGIESSFEVHLVRIGPYRFVDFFPRETNISNELYKSHLLPTHSFARLTKSGDTLKLAFLNHEWIKRLAESHRLSITAQPVRERYVLTASTAQLQKFVRKHALTPDAFMEPLILIGTHN